MKPLGQPHERCYKKFVYRRRVQVLADHFSGIIPPGSRVLDVGCGDGYIAKLIKTQRPDITLEGVDILLRSTTHIPIRLFDGKHLPYADNEVDAVLLIDVLHHTDDPAALLGEVARVAKTHIFIKDHTLQGWLARPTLRVMDWFGNACYGVRLPYNYWPEQRWRDTIAGLKLKVGIWRKDVGLYPFWATWLFGRSLHFIARLDVIKPAGEPRGGAA